MQFNYNLYNQEVIPARIRIRYERRASNIDCRTCYIMFGMNQIKLIQLIEAVKLPDTVLCSNGSRFSGEEAFLIMLARFVEPLRFITMENFFGRDYTQL